MRSIFLKIFLWFWLTVALVSATFFLLGLKSGRVEINPNRQDFVFKTLVYYSQSAINIKGRDGDAAFASFIKNLEEHLLIRSYIFDESGQQIYGVKLPVVAEELIQQPQHNGMEVKGGNSTAFIYLKRSASDGRNLNFIWEVRFGRPPHMHVESTIPYQVARILAIFIAAALLCYWLSSYLTKPIIQMTEAAQRLANGELSARVGTLVTNRKDELAEMGNNFNFMADRISYLLAAQKRLIRDISHELRSPLARLNVALMLARKKAGEQAGGALDRIELESERLNELIEQLLTLAKLENAQDTIKFEPVNLDQVIQELAADADFEAQSINRAVKVVNVEHCEVNGDETLLRRAIENVLRNAIRYTAEETAVEVSLFCQQIINKTYAVISVRDHGQGVPTETLRELFRPFYRVSDSRERVSGGTGLGLAIVEQAVKLHHGQVNAANALEGGLKIDIQIPIL